MTIDFHCRLDEERLTVWHNNRHRHCDRLGKGDRKIL